VFSTATRSTTSTPYGSGVTASATTSAVSWPRGADNARNAIPESTADELDSVVTTCAVASATTVWPERANTCSAIWFAIVPVAT